MKYPQAKEVNSVEELNTELENLTARGFGVTSVIPIVCNMFTQGNNTDISSYEMTTCQIKYLILYVVLDSSK